MENPVNRIPSTVEYTSMEKMQEQLYRTLSQDKTRAAVLLGERDVVLLIKGMRALAASDVQLADEALRFKADLEILRREVYG